MMDKVDLISFFFFFQLIDFLSLVTTKNLIFLEKDRNNYSVYLNLVPDLSLI